MRRKVSGARRVHRHICLVLLLLGEAAGAGSLLPNPGFREGVGNRPADWNLAEGRGAWLPPADGRTAALRLEGRGDDTASWRTAPLPLMPGALVQFRFRARREPGASGGTAFAGAGAVHRDFPLTIESRDHRFVFAVPGHDRGPAARLGQWQVKGGLVFESAELFPVRAEYARFEMRGVPPFELGEGESVRAGVYGFDPDLNGAGSNASRVVVTNRVGFNSNRWLFDAGGDLVFRHAVGTLPLRDGRVRVSINHHVSGTLVMGVSTNGIVWRTLGEFDGTRRSGETALPPEFSPANAVWIRLEARGASVGFQVDTYAFTARVDAGDFEGEGSTDYFDEDGRLTRPASLLDGPAFGHALTGAEGWSLWWCEGSRKVGRQTPAPAAPAESGKAIPLAVSLAGGEYEPAQVVLRPNRAAHLREAGMLGMRDPAGRVSTVTVKVEEVAYVQVTRPTDAACQRGWYPDPLPPLRLPLELRAGENQPLWLTFHAPTGAVAGVHRGELRLLVDDTEVRVPLAVEVYDFELPRETTLRSALGLGMGEIARYHRLTNRADRVAVFEKYLANFAEHRISPYSFYDHAPIEVTFPGEGPGQRARVSFEAFDRAAERWLNGAKFNTFQLPLQGMGGGTFHSRHPGRLAGFDEGTPEHARLFRDYLGQVERHLAERGWLGRAFTYWFDEPDPKDYDFVVAGMKRLKDAAPGIRRMLTEQPEAALLGHVDIWCGLTPEWTSERVRERRASGEEVWWYICTAPKEPYVTEFIDHPGTELRLWPWQSWQYGVTGILVWATVYWTSPLAYPEPTLQDPWRDPMSWVSGYGFPVGHRGPWGNGDGRFLYPPRRDPNRSLDPNFDAPINSLRWENLRDGMEDYEYLELLRREVVRREAEGGSAEALARAKSLLTVPPEISKGLTQFTVDPKPILEHRDKVARAIVELRGRR